MGASSSRVTPIRPPAAVKTNDDPAHTQGHDLRAVVVVLQETAKTMDISAVWEAFGAHRAPEAGFPRFHFEFVSETPGSPLEMFGATNVLPRCGLECAVGADLVFVAPTAGPSAPVSLNLAQTLRTVLLRGGLVMGADRSVFTLAEAGLLDGRRATTHWALADELTRRFPAIDVASGALYVDDGQVLTAAGASATLDLCLHVIRRYFGAASSAALGRQLVIGPPRQGHQQQIARPPDGDRQQSDDIAALLDWALDHIHEELSVEALARQGFMSPRSLARRFRCVTGTTPYAWVLEQRLRLACELLERADGPTVEEVARRTGFGRAHVLRRHFQRALGCTPTAYRRRHVARQLNADAAAQALTALADRPASLA